MTETQQEIPVSAPLAAGAAVIKNHLKTLPATPGVYRMLSERGDVLYVGKAKNLKNRVSNYTIPQRLNNRLQRMVAETHAMEVVVTSSETEALLLESNMIKKLLPRYNVLLRDDKMFPYILLATDHPFPQIIKHRGKRDRPGHYFGPFASAGLVNQTINALQRSFLIRPCSDSYFKARKKPCLQYQIKRCSAPCVGYINEQDYTELVKQTCTFLKGQGGKIQQELARNMQTASDAQHYERAAMLRDRIRAITQIQAKQDINVAALEDADVIALDMIGSRACIQVFFFRASRNYGNRAFYPTQTAQAEPAEIMESFLVQFYTENDPPPLLLLSHALSDDSMMPSALQTKIEVPKRGAKADVVAQAVHNAREALARRIAESNATVELLAGVATLFGLPSSPQRIEVYDNSHIQGRHAIGGMIVAGAEGFNKKAYRKFNIKNSEIKPGDDYAMLREVITRRFSGSLKDKDAVLPDLLLIDGGRGQLNAVLEALKSRNLSIPVVGIAKGVDRNAGRERFFQDGKPDFTLPPNDPVLFYLQRLRDEVHRFAITSHRDKRAKDNRYTTLDDLPNVGAVRKKALLAHFGSARAVSSAAIEDLQNVTGISKKLAQQIHAYYHVR